MSYFPAADGEVRAPTVSSSYMIPFILVCLRDNHIRFFALRLIFHEKLTVPIKYLPILFLTDDEISCGGVHKYYLYWQKRLKFARIAKFSKMRLEMP